MIGTDLAHFTITAKLGEGGMGEVYRARDGKLGREVALKILPEAFVADPDRIARFEREARLLASLNHPNIAGIYEVGAAEGVHFLAMELAPGETLAAKLEGGALSVDEALRIALRIATALEAAHRQGIVHRDLKPANVVVGDDGSVKVLDFGLAKALETTVGPEGTGAALSQSPTLTARMTNAGMILGTAAYMSPEQAKGEEADKRSDNWSFGVVLWEMLTGRKAFGEKTVSESLAAVLMREPDLGQLPPGTPRRVRRVLERCLQKDPDRRLHDIADGRLELEAALDGEEPEPIEPHPGSGRSVRVWQAVAAILLLAVLGLGGLEIGPRMEAPRVVRSTILPPDGAVLYLPGAHPGPAVVSPDGSQIAFTARRDGAAEPALWVRPVDSLLARELPSTEGAGYPFWSPDGRHVGFFTGSTLKKIAVAGGPPVTLAPADYGKGASWSPEGWIVFAGGAREGISVVSEAGGEARRLTTVDAEAGENSHRHPRFLPDGERFLYFVRRDRGDGVLRVGSIAGGDPVELVESETNGQVVSERLLFVWDGTLMAQPFDPHRLEVTGEAVPLVEELLVVSEAGLGVYSASEEGTLVYQTGAGDAPNRLVWIDREGNATAANAEEDQIYAPRLAPDGTRALAVIRDPEKDAYDIWLHDLERGIRNRLTFREDAGTPVWSPDGERFAYNTAGFGDRERAVWTQPIAGTEEETLVTTTERPIVTIDWSPDGEWITAILFGPQGGADIARIPAAGGPPEMLLDTEAIEAFPVLSPDGRWLAYHYQEPGHGPQVFVTTFPEPGRRWQVSVEGGYAPNWPGDGREIFFRTDGAFWTAAVDAGGDSFAVGEVTRLFDLPNATSPGDFDVAADGQRFLFSLAVDEGETRPITMVQGWEEGLP